MISKLRGELAAGSPEETGSYFFFRWNGAESDSGEVWSFGFPTETEMEKSK